MPGPKRREVYEVGLKGNFDGFGFNLAVFKQNLKGFQSNVFTGTGFVLGNAEKQSTKGFEARRDAVADARPDLHRVADLSRSEVRQVHRRIGVQSGDQHRRCRPT